MKNIITFITALLLCSFKLATVDIILHDSVKDFPQTIQKSILENRDEFISDLEILFENDKNLFIFCNRQNSTQYNPDDLVNLSKYRELSKSKSTLKLRKEAADALLELQRSTNIILPISSSYRSYNYQKRIYENNAYIFGIEETDKWIARPGTSQHQLGTSVDFGTIDAQFEFTKAGQWLFKNAHKYGWSLSYPKGKELETGYGYECWHYRYITKKGCEIQQKYFDNSQHFFLKYVYNYYDLLKEKY